MNAPASIELLLVEAHRSAVEEVNRWRGYCVNHFARGELLIGKALLAAAPAKKLPMLLGQKLEELRKLCPDGSKKWQTLVEFGALADDRNAVVHGEGRVFIDQQGKWLLSLHSLNRDGIRMTTLTEADAIELSDRLKKVVRQLSSHFDP